MRYLLLAIIAAALTGCGGGSDNELIILPANPTATPTVTPTTIPTANPTPLPTVTPEPTNTPVDEGNLLPDFR